MKMALGNIVGCFHKTQETTLCFKHPILIIKCKEINRQNKKNVLFFQRFGAFYNMFRSNWPSSGNETVCKIRGRNLTTWRVIKRNEVSFFT